MKKKSLLVITLMLLIAAFMFSLTACEIKPAGGTLESLQNQHGVTVKGGSFEEGSILVSNEIAAPVQLSAL